MTDSMTAIAELILKAKKILLVTHVNPDGDALGTSTGLARAMRAAGKEASIALPGTTPVRHDFILFDENIASADGFPALAEEADLIIVADTCSHRQLDDINPLMPPYREKTVVIDHHATVDDIGTVRWIDSSSAAAGVMALELLDALSWPVTMEIAEPLAVAILTDTGWLRFSNTDPRCLHAMARLVEAGIGPDVMFKKIYQSDRFEKLKLLGRVLDSLELHCDGLLAVMSLSEDDFHQTGARPDETENLVNEAMRIGEIEAAVILVQNGDEIRVSLRSRQLLDVSLVAETLGGGGHTRAAGARFSGDLQKAKQTIIATISEKLQQL